MSRQCWRLRQSAEAGRQRRSPPARLRGLVRISVLHAKCFDSRAIRASSDVQFVVPLEHSQRGGGLPPHPTVHCQMGTVRIQSGLHTLDEFCMRHMSLGCSGGWCGRLRHRSRLSRCWGRWRGSCSLRFAGGTTSKCHADHDQCLQAKPMVGVRHKVALFTSEHMLRRHGGTRRSSRNVHSGMPPYPNLAPANRTLATRSH